MIDRFGPYAPQFARMLEAAEPSIETPTYHVHAGVFPKSAQSCDAWLITGSRSGAYDPHPWITRLADFIRAAYEQRVPLIGVCFGHQIMAHALGGLTELSDKGWGLGLQSYETLEPVAWRPTGFGRGRPLRLHAMHKDQVVRVPPDARVIARSDFCENAALVYGPVGAPRAISLQPHPEFSADVAEALIRLRRGDGIAEPLADAALATLGSAVDSAEVATWMTAFLRRATTGTRS